MEIRISRLHYPVTTLGPGRRIGIWLQGCSIHCPGCISADTWTTNAGMTLLDNVLAHLAPWLTAAEGITISGGEPFDQPEALIALLAALRARTPVDILVYSGYPAARLAALLVKTDGLIDALIADPFDIDAAHTRPLRGSDNQRLHLLTPLGQARFAQYERALSDQDKALDAMFDEQGGVWFAGIPARGDFQRLQALLTDQGHRVRISVDTARGSRTDRAKEQQE